MRQNELYVSKTLSQPLNDQYCLAFYVHIYNLNLLISLPSSINVTERETSEDSYQRQGIVLRAT